VITIALKARLTMPLDLITVPCLADNYAFVIGNTDTGEAAVVDVPEAAPINAAVKDRGWTVKTVLLTHHHADHVMGLDDLIRTPDAAIIGATADQHRLPPLTQAVGEGDTIQLCGEPASVMDVSGHTVGHIAIYLPAIGAAFTADSLMALGCGRLFEGTPAQMWDSLLKLRALPDETIVCSGHEYTASNAKFAATIDPDNPHLISRIKAITTARAANLPTVPSPLGLEKQTNPFLRADDPALKTALGMQSASDSDVFAEIRKRKDNF
jgi:hydroxyacylglutathione hydrolase